MKRILYIFAAFLMVFTLAACSGGDSTDKNGQDGTPGDGGQEEIKILYTVYVKDPLGMPIANMIVDITKDGEILKSYVTGSDGKVAAKEESALPDGKYGIALRDPYGKEFYFDEKSAFIDKDNKEVTVTVYKTSLGSGTMTIYPSDSDVSVSASIFSDGGYRIELKKGDNYLIFIPTVRGCYKISLDGDGLSSPEYRGAPHFVQSINVAGTEGTEEVYTKDGDLFFNIRVFNVGDTPEESSRYVIMVKADDECYANLTISADENLPLSDEERPWDSVRPSEIPTPFTLPEGVALTNLDLTDKETTIVYNSDDNRYHLNTADGPVLLLKVNTASPYIDSFRAIMDTTHLGTYIRDKEGNLIAKRDYHALMESVSECADENTGVYPLTPDTLAMINDIGASWGWFTAGAPNYLFSSLTEPNEELLLYFATVYVSE